MGITTLSFKFQNSSEETLGLTKVEACTGTQIFEDVPEDQPENDPVWRPVPHVAADKHTTGQAQYIDDLPRFKGED